MPFAPIPNSLAWKFVNMHEIEASHEKLDFQNSKKFIFQKSDFEALSSGHHLVNRCWPKVNKCWIFRKYRKNCIRCQNLKEMSKIEFSKHFDHFFDLELITCAQCNLFQNFCFKIVSKKMFQNCFKIGSLGFKIEPKMFQNFTIKCSDFFSKWGLKSTIKIRILRDFALS